MQSSEIVGEVPTGMKTVCKWPTLPRPAKEQSAPKKRSFVFTKQQKYH